MTDSWDTSGDSPWATLWKGSTRRVTLTRAEVGPFSTVTMRKKLTFAETPVQGPEMVKVGLKLVFLPPRARPLAITLSCCLLQCQRNLRTWYESAFRHRWIPFYHTSLANNSGRKTVPDIWRSSLEAYVQLQLGGFSKMWPGIRTAKWVPSQSNGKDRWCHRHPAWVTLEEGEGFLGRGRLNQAWISIFWILLFLLPPLFCWSRCLSGFFKKLLGFCIPIRHLKQFFSIFILDW